MAEVKIPRFKYNPPKEQLTEEELLKAVGEMSYQSPVEIISQNIQEKFEGDMMQIIHSYDIHVDKDELVKALAYDRDQYKKGFADGCRLSMNRIKSEVAREIFKEIDEERDRWEAVYSRDYFGYGGDAYGYLESDVDHTIAELKKKYTEEK